MKAWQLLSDRSKWTKNALARDANGYPTDANSPEAVKWCASGAIHRCYRDARKRTRAIRKAQRLTGIGSLWSLNDREGYDAVLAILKDCDV
jgi:hypothetical protein